MNSLWDQVKAVSTKAGVATKIAATRGKLNADIVLIDREINARKQKFGVEMYDYVSPLSQNADFYAATDQLTEILRGPLINAQREIKAMELKRHRLKEEQAHAEVTRAGAFPTKAETIGEKLKNAGKSTYLAGGETKIKAQLVVLERQMTAIKNTFGLELYSVLVEAEDTRSYLPSDRSIRGMYDACRNDISAMENRQEEKRNRMKELGGPQDGDAASSSGASTSASAGGQQNVSPSGPPSSSFQDFPHKAEADDNLL